MSKYNKYSVKSKETKKTWHYFVATNKMHTERFRTTEELHKLINNRVKELNLKKSVYLTNLILADCGYEVANSLLTGKELREWNNEVANW